MVIQVIGGNDNNRSVSDHTFEGELPCQLIVVVISN